MRESLSKAFCLVLLISDPRLGDPEWQRLLNNPFVDNGLENFCCPADSFIEERMGAANG